MATSTNKQRPGKPGRPLGRQNNRTLLLQAGLDKAIPDDYFWRKVKEFIEAGDAQVLIQVGKWKGLKEKHEVDLSGIPADGIFRVING